MSRTICLRCRASFQQSLCPKQQFNTLSRRAYSSERANQTRNKAPDSRKAPLDIAALLSKPTWSVRSLLPTSTPKAEITSKQLHHLLRLSALPLPSSPEEEASMLATLHSQLHFVRDIQNVDTEGVEPLQSIRDETEEGIRDATIGLEDLREALGEEEFKGRNRRPRRKRAPPSEKREIGMKEWDVLETASETMNVGSGRYFVVRSGKESLEKEDAVKDKK